MTKNIEEFDIKTKVHIEFIRDSKQLKIQEINHHQKAVIHVIFNKAGTIFATCSDDHCINIYSALDYQLLRTYAMDNAVKNILFLNKEDKLITSNSLGTFSIYDVFSPTEEPVFHYHNNDKRNICMASSYGDQYLAIIITTLFKEEDD